VPIFSCYLYPQGVAIWKCSVRTTAHSKDCSKKSYKVYFCLCRFVLLLVTDPEARVRFPALPEKKVVGLERGPLSLVSTTEELLDRKVAALV
jgi:hypothetical protein